MYADSCKKCELMSAPREKQKGTTNLLSDPPSHVSLRSLQCTESFAKVELNVISLAFHTDTQQKPALSIQVKPVLSR